MCNFGLKMVIFGPFQSLPLGGGKILTFQTWLRKSLVMPSWSQGAKLAWKMPFRGKKLDLSNLAQRVSSIALVEPGCKVPKVSIKTI